MQFEIKSPGLCIITSDGSFRNRMFYNRIANTKSKVLCPKWLDELYAHRPRDLISEVNKYITDHAYIELSTKYGLTSQKSYGDYIYFVNEIDAMAIKLYFS